MVGKKNQQTICPWSILSSILAVPLPFDSLNVYQNKQKYKDLSVCYSTAPTPINISDKTPADFSARDRTLEHGFLSALLRMHLSALLSPLAFLRVGF